jgi:uncharacterized cupin superfamily protein
MSSDVGTAIRLVRPSDVTWEEAPRGEQEKEPPGAEFTAFVDGAFSTGFWRRNEQDRPIVRPYHEIAYIIEGDVEVTTDDGSIIHAGPGDILITPKGCTGHWKNLSPVRKFWAIFEA